VCPAVSRVYTDARSYVSVLCRVIETRERCVVLPRLRRFDPEREPLPPLREGACPMRNPPSPAQQSGLAEVMTVAVLPHSYLR
jgi:hypothetical protein